MADIQSKDTFYLPELDALRGVAVSMVFLHHALSSSQQNWSELKLSPLLFASMSTLVRTGSFGVDLFFTLSGYLITRLLLAELAKTGKIHLGAFLVRRSLRIWPLYFGYLLFRLPFLLHSGGGNSSALDALPWYLTFVGNWYVVAHGYPEGFIGHLWSVCVEEQFYLFWPLMLFLVGGFRSRQAVIALFVCGALVRYSLIRIGASEEALWAGTFANLDPLLMGVALAVFGGDAMTGDPINHRARRLVCLVLGAAILFFCGNLQVWQSVGANIIYPAAALGCGMLFIGVRSSGFGQAGVVGRALGSLGRVSYGFYVFHTLSINLASRILDNPWFSVPAAALICWLAAMLSFHALERPFLALRARWTFIASGAPDWR